jgi:hypothetical protein
MAGIPESVRAGVPRLDVGLTETQASLIGAFANAASLTALVFRGACTRPRVKDVAPSLQEATA